MASIGVTHVLDPLLRCASRRCTVPVHGFDADHFAGVFSCTRCGSRSFAIRFHDGSAREQLGAIFGWHDEPFVDAVVGHYRLPIAFKRPEWLSIWIPNDDYRQYRHDVTTDVAGRSRNLLKRQLGN